jgi:hypothetical protein
MAGRSLMIDRFAACASSEFSKISGTTSRPSCPCSRGGLCAWPLPASTLHYFRSNWSFCSRASASSF